MAVAFSRSVSSRPLFCRWLRPPPGEVLGPLLLLPIPVAFGDDDRIGAPFVLRGLLLVAGESPSPSLRWLASARASERVEGKGEAGPLRFVVTRIRPTTTAIRPGDTGGLRGDGGALAPGVRGGVDAAACVVGGVIGLLMLAGEAAAPWQSLESLEGDGGGGGWTAYSAEPLGHLTIDPGMITRP